MTQREREINKDIRRVGDVLSKVQDPNVIEALQKLFVVLQAWKGN